MSLLAKKIVGICIGSLIFLELVAGIVSTLVLVNFFLKRPPTGWPDPSETPKGSRAPFFEQVKESKNWLNSMNPEKVSINSFDNLKLTAKFLPADNAKGSVILMHGYHSEASFEFAGFYEYFHNEGYNVLICDQRGHGNSEGTYLTFGIKERYDCKDWINYLINRLGENEKIWLCGVSMGSSTVMMTLGFDLPANVQGAIADCGFTSPEEILSNTMILSYHLPAPLLMPFINIGTKLICGYSPTEYTTLDAFKTNKVPVLFVHGTNDTFVPYKMSEENFEACKAPKTFLSTKAEHAANFLTEPEQYKAALKEFMK